ncbi:MaoC/PaaZ C-terminal domain-containing protein [Pseudofrankia sp. BMG5.37]|nr:MULTISPECIES: MaoC/PaaZ C-terminal domain-containing protein [unclassified Pseudofrankia]MDT3446714.1 MaoC/PaaZ C-terminal domain-containing protein [Pseudofrankia sp. BMG5.37]
MHVDPERAAAGPFGTTIAHGFLTLSLVAPLVEQVYRVEGVSMGVNYGLNKVRLPAPVPSGSRGARRRGTGVSRADRNGSQATGRATIEIERLAQARMRRRVPLAAGAVRWSNYPDSIWRGSPRGSTAPARERRPGRCGLGCLPAGAPTSPTR